VKRTPASKKGGILSKAIFVATKPPPHKKIINISHNRPFRSKSSFGKSTCLISQSLRKIVFA
jgi:hypothetical protein